MGKIKEFFGWRGGHGKPAKLKNLRLKKIVDLVMDMGNVVEKKVGQHVGKNKNEQSTYDDWPWDMNLFDSQACLSDP